MDYSILGWSLCGVKGHRVEKSIYSPEYDRFRAMLRQLREDSGLTQTQLARELGWTQTKVSKCERGERRLDIVEVRRWCGAMGISFATFAKRLDGELDGRKK